LGAGHRGNAASTNRCVLQAHPRSVLPEGVDDGPARRGKLSTSANSQRANEPRGRSAECLRCHAAPKSPDRKPINLDECLVSIALPKSSDDRRLFHHETNSRKR